MTFKKLLEPYSAQDIIAALGCPQSVAYSWKDGARKPPAWQWRHWLRQLRLQKRADVK